MNPLFTALQESIATVAERVGPAVVGLGRGWSRGSGVVVAPGRVLTAAHALRGDQVAVAFLDGRTAEGRVAGADTDLDIAVVLADTGDAAPVEWAPAAGAPALGAAGAAALGERPAGAPAPALGAVVFALANPGGSGLRVTFGTVSATGRGFRGPRGRRITGSIEHTAPLPRGSSGGPLVDPDGRLLGLNAVRREGGLILAVPVDAARVEALAAGEAPARPRLGVALAHPRAARLLRAAVGLPERAGLLVHAVVDGSPAERAGLERGDLVVAAAGAPLASADDLFDAPDRAGDVLTLRVLRGAEERDVEVHFSS
jgi:serine protease Do